MHHVISVLGTMGVERSDFENSFLLDPIVIGKGSYGTVHRAAYLQKDANSILRTDECLDVAVKLTTKQSAMRELTALVGIGHHPNVISLVGVFRRPENQGSNEAPWAESGNDANCLIVTQFCPGGNLFQCVSEQGPLQGLDAERFAFGLLSGLQHIHSCRIVHRDVKAENILFGASRKPVLADFGLAARLEDKEEMQRQCGSLGYVAPEVLSGECYGEKVDIFSVGICLFYALSGMVPFKGDSKTEVWEKTVQCHVEFDRNSWSVVRPEFVTLAKMLLERIAENRPTAVEALEIARHLCDASQQHASPRSTTSKQRTPSKSWVAFGA
jgi:serine/threonine protein kinase